MESIKMEAIRIAILAGEKIKELRDNNQYQESLKDGYELVTTADIVSNDIIKTEILKKYPDHKFISEEEYGQTDLCIFQPTWIVDPIDGTVGYANNQYQVAVSIAFAIENKIQVGVVYNPFLNELFYAIAEKGAFLNDRPIKIKDICSLKQSVIGTGFPHKREHLKEIMIRIENLLPQIRDIRRLGSPALDICWVACGRMQGFYEGKLSPWDIAAARLIAIEAGAKVGYFSERKNDNIPECINGDNIIVSSPGIYEELLEILNKE